MKITNKKYLLIAATSILTFFIVFLYVQTRRSNKQAKRDEPRQNTETTKLFESKTLKFSVEVPNAYEVKENGPEIVFLNKGNNISISMNGTNLTDLDEYLDWLHQANKTTFQRLENGEIDNGQYVKGSLGDKMEVFIYLNYRIYLFSTISPELYDDLDQIAKSFKYLGD